MSNSTQDNTRIAKNTTFLYIRMLLSIIVSLYTSRVVLQVLGEVNYGIYGLVGSVVAMFTFLNTTMSGATARFLTHDMAKGDAQRLHNTFNTALLIHIGIAILVLIFAETIGLWFLHNKLVIPEDRMFAANVVYQLSILSMMITITQVPYNAAIIAHERMDIYAYVELVNVTLKLVIVYILLIGNMDRLILYAVLVLCTSCIVAFIYRYYCIKHYNESHFKIVYKPEIIKPMLTFSLYDLYGNLSITARQQGTNIIINMFFGIVLNAASGIATMVQGIISGFSGNILQAFRPQIIKSYAVGNIVKMENLMINAIKFALLLLMIITIPLCIEIDYVMHIWLGDVPEYAPKFCRILLLMNLVGVINTVLTIAIHATGNIKRLSFFAGTVALLNLPAMYILFKFITKVPEYAYITQFVSAVIMVIIELFIICKQIPSIKITSIIKAILVTLITGAVSILPTIPAYMYIDTHIIRVVTVTIIYMTILVICFYIFILGKKEKAQIKDFVIQKIKK